MNTTLHKLTTLPIQTQTSTKFAREIVVPECLVSGERYYVQHRTQSQSFIGIFDRFERVNYHPNPYISYVFKDIMYIQKNMWTRHENYADPTFVTVYTDYS